MKKVTQIEICGKKFNLAFTVKASRQLDEMFGGIERMAEGMDSGSIGEKLEKTMKVLAILLRGGYENEKSVAEVTGSPFSAAEPPDADVLMNIYTLGDLGALEESIFGAISSEEPDVQVKTKNVKATPGE